MAGGRKGYSSRSLENKGPNENLAARAILVLRIVFYNLTPAQYCFFHLSNADLPHLFSFKHNTPGQRRRNAIRWNRLGGIGTNS
jgi:hypothetical protein